MKLLTPAVVLLSISTASACASFCSCYAHNFCFMPGGGDCDVICAPYNGALFCNPLAYLNLAAGQWSRIKKS
ncbi:hypothetical protein PTMSG1_04631 [Pyrenophora teres f. maculata]|nr:hypothetical protein PTMSG1_04631 [Pyrenophora teres f. maculata]